MNRLSLEISPYLLQHQHNPVDWYPWGEEALDRACREDKPIFLSIGYATCHWCHVMEGDSFEKADVAAILNTYFVAIKVDREERPDIDGIYMKAVQAMNQRGGWPLSVLLTPAGKPFWGGTFFPREEFKGILQQVAGLWHQQRPAIEDSASELTAHLEIISSQGTKAQGFRAAFLDRFCQQQVEAYDQEWGGFGGAPKFPPAMALMAMLRQRQPDAQLIAAICGTLDAMARGGIRDHVGGGFHRYAVDATWLVPHFEKMLYDNALLTLAYSEAYQLTRKDEYREVVETTTAYLLRDLQHAEGGFYAAEDADSEKTEGKFYVWTVSELETALRAEEWATMQSYFRLESAGNFTVDRRVEALEAAAGLKALHAANILHHQRVPSLPTRADPRYRQLLDRLFTLRAQRVRPGLDDKILCAWNGLTIAALAKAYRVLGHAALRKGAERAASFLLTHVQREGHLLRSHRRGTSRFAAYLEDYASLIFGLIELYQASFEPRWLLEALTLQQLQDQLFWDANEGIYFETDGRDPTVLMRSKELADHATPCGNSLSALNLLHLSALTGTTSWAEQAERVLQGSAGVLEKYPSLLPMMLQAVALATGPRRVLIISTPAAPAWPELCPQLAPDAVFLRYDPQLLASCPQLQGKEPGTAAGYYVCEQGRCLLPTAEHQAALQQLLAV